jgi:hypothetical protein
MNTLRDKLAYYTESYDFVLFDAVSQILAYFNGIEALSFKVAPTL